MARPLRPVFSPRGVPVRVDASMWVVAALVAWSFWSRFSTTASRGAAIAMAAAATALFFVSILAHELAHALEARRRGLAVEDITLYIFGGATRITSETSRAADEFGLTIVGPWTSIVLGCGFGLVAYGADTAGLHAVAEVAGELGWLNLILGCFNLLPGAPLDGGRVLDAIVWRLTGDRSRAAAVSTRAGQVLGAMIASLGLAEVLFVVGGFVGGLWLMLIGWFLIRAAGTERSLATLRTRLAGHRVRDLVVPMVSVPTGSRVDAAVDAAFRIGRSDTVVVVDNGGIVGVVTLEDAQKLRGRSRHRLLVDEVMKPLESLPKVLGSAPAADVLPLLGAEPLVVLEGGFVKSVMTDRQLTSAIGWLEAPDPDRMPASTPRRVIDARGTANPVSSAATLAARPAVLRRGLWVTSGIIVLAGLAFVPMPVFELRPGPALDVPSLLETSGPDHHPSGRILLTAVTISSPSAFGVARAWIEPHSEVVGRASLVPTGMTPTDYEMSQRQVFADSTRLAVAVALRAAGYDVRIGGGGVVVRVVGAGGPADGKLQPGDIVTGVAGRSVTTVTDMIAALQRTPSGSTTILEIRRGEQNLRIEIRPGPPNALGVPVLDVAIEDALPDVTLPFSVRVSRSDIGGPSAGLMTALSVYAITTGEDLTGGRTVAGTGTIDSNGNVGLVGGVAEKVVAASDAGASLFLVPSSEANTARKAAQGHRIKVVAVNTFADSLAVLKTHNP